MKDNHKNEGGCIIISITNIITGLVNNIIQACLQKCDNYEQK